MLEPTWGRRRSIIGDGGRKGSGVTHDRTRACVCGHVLAAHEHLRRGLDCALCRPGGCPSYVAAGGLRGRLVAMQRRRRDTRGDGRADRWPTVPDRVQAQRG